MTVIFRPVAVEDLVAAAAWYETQASGLGEDLIDEVLAAVRRAQGNPELFRVVHREGNVRRVLTDRFPYRIFFSVVSDTLYVHAVLHGARHAHRWRERL
jgi:plasmid stabilization system protein ParE